MSESRSQSAYQQVASALRQQILQGQFAPGEQLPAERELCSQYAASRITIRRALEVLADEMLIQRRHGSGTFVSPTPARQIPILATDFSGSMAAHAPDLTRQLDAWQWQKPPDAVAAMFGERNSERVLFARRIDLLDDVPVAFDEIYLAEPTADRLDKIDLAELRFLERWQEVQRIGLDYLTQSIEAVASDAHQAKYLPVKIGAPLLKEIDVFYLPAGAPCGLFTSYYRSDLFRLTSTLRLQSDRAR